MCWSLCAVLPPRSTRNYMAQWIEIQSLELNWLGSNPGSATCHLVYGRWTLFSALVLDWYGWHQQTSINLKSCLSLPLKSPGSSPEREQLGVFIPLLGSFSARLSWTNSALSQRSLLPASCNWLHAPPSPLSFADCFLPASFRLRGSNSLLTPSSINDSPKPTFAISLFCK